MLKLMFVLSIIITCLLGLVTFAPTGMFAFVIAGVIISLIGLLIAPTVFFITLTIAIFYLAICIGWGAIYAFSVVSGFLLLVVVFYSIIKILTGLSY